MHSDEDFEDDSHRGSLAVSTHCKSDKAKVAFLPFLRLEDEAFLNRTEFRENIFKFSPRSLQGQVGHLGQMLYL